MIAASCLTVLSDFYGQLTSRLEHIADMETELFSRWTLFVELFTGPTVQSRHHLWTGVNSKKSGTLDY